MLVPLAHVDGGGHRNLHTGRVLLLVEGGLLDADEEDDQDIRRRILDIGDRGAELGDVERDELLADDFATLLLDGLLEPVSGQLTEVVIGGDGVEAGPEQLHHRRHEWDNLVIGHAAGGVDPGVADASLVLVVIEEERLVLVDDRPDGFA